MGRGRTKSPSSLGPVQPQQRALRSRRRESVMSSENQTKHNPPEALQPRPPQPAPPGPAQEPATESALVESAPTSCWAGPATDRAVKESEGETSGLTSSLRTPTLSERDPDKREDSVEVEELSTALCGPLTEVGGAEGFETLYPTGQTEEGEDGNKHQKSEPACSAEDREAGAEPVVGTLSRKRKRMGMCVLTEKERSQFLQKHENEELQREAEEKRVGDRGHTGHGMGEPLEKEPVLPTGGAGDSSSEAACEEIGDARSPRDPPPVSARRTRASKDRGRGPPGDRDTRPPTEIAGRIDEPEKQEKVKEAVVEPRPSPTQVTSRVHTVLPASQPEEVQPPQLSTDSWARTGGRSETQGSQPSHSFRDTGLGRSETIGTQPGTAAAAPSGGEENDNSGPLEEADIAASPAPQHPLARGTPDLVGFGPFDYISDSQLHDISLMEALGDSSPSHCLEDASAQVRGLGRELSYLNRIIMATQRKVETLRRGNRGPKAH